MRGAPFTSTNHVVVRAETSLRRDAVRVASATSSPSSVAPLDLLDEHSSVYVSMHLVEQSSSADVSSVSGGAAASLLRVVEPLDSPRGGASTARQRWERFERLRRAEVWRSEERPLVVDVDASLVVDVVAATAGDAAAAAAAAATTASCEWTPRVLNLCAVRSHRTALHQRQRRSEARALAAWRSRRRQLRVWQQAGRDDLIAEHERALQQEQTSGAALARLQRHRHRTAQVRRRSSVGGDPAAVTLTRAGDAALVLRVWAVSRRGGVSIFAEPADDVLVGEALTSLSWLAANVGGSLPLTTPTAARTFAGTIELAWLPPFPAAIDVVGGRTPPRCDPRALCAALFRLGDGRRTAVLAKADFTDYLAAMLECYFAESPAAAIAAMAALRSVADNPTLKVLLEGHHYDEGHRDYANATNTAIMVGDQIVPSMLRIECGLDCPTATTSRRVQQLLGRFARTTAQRTATIVFAPQSSATQQHKHGEEVDVVAFHKIYAAHEKQLAASRTSAEHITRYASDTDVAARTTTLLPRFVPWVEQELALAGGSRNAAAHATAVGAAAALHTSLWHAERATFAAMRVQLSRSYFRADLSAEQVLTWHFRPLVRPLLRFGPADEARPRPGEGGRKSGSPGGWKSEHFSAAFEVAMIEAAVQMNRSIDAFCRCGAARDKGGAAAGLLAVEGEPTSSRSPMGIEHVVELMRTVQHFACDAAVKAMNAAQSAEAAEVHAADVAEAERMDRGRASTSPTQKNIPGTFSIVNNEDERLDGATTPDSTDRPSTELSVIGVVDISSRWIEVAWECEEAETASRSGYTQRRPSTLWALGGEGNRSRGSSSGNPTGVPLDERDFGVTEALKHAQFAIDEVLLQLLRATSSPSLDADGGSSSSSGSASSSAQRGSPLVRVRRMVDALVQRSEGAADAAVEEFCRGNSRSTAPLATVERGWLLLSVCSAIIAPSAPLLQLLLRHCKIALAEAGGGVVAAADEEDALPPLAAALAGSAPLATSAAAATDARGIVGGGGAVSPELEAALAVEDSTSAQLIRRAARSIARVGTYARLTHKRLLMTSRLRSEGIVRAHVPHSMELASLLTPVPRSPIIVRVFCVAVLSSSSAPTTQSSSLSSSRVAKKLQRRMVDVAVAGAFVDVATLHRDACAALGASAEQTALYGVHRGGEELLEALAAGGDASANAIISKAQRVPPESLVMEVLAGWHRRTYEFSTYAKEVTTSKARGWERRPDKGGRWRFELRTRLSEGGRPRRTLLKTAAV